VVPEPLFEVPVAVAVDVLVASHLDVAEPDVGEDQESALELSLGCDLVSKEV
jgi:hypothetical protein